MALDNVGQMSVSLLGDISKFNRDMDKAGGKVDGFANKMTTAGTKIASAGKAMALAITLPLLGFGAAALKFAGDAEEIQSKFEAVFKQFSEDTEAWISEFAAAVNRNTTDLKEYASVFQDTFVPLGFAREEAAELSKRLVELTIDLASFNNASEPETMRALQSAIVGNHETVRRYGIIIDQATIELELMNAGLAESYEAATAAEKAQARLNLIIKGSADAQGDATRTAESYVNQMKGLKGELKEVGEDIGEVLIPMVLRLVEEVKGMVAAWRGLDDETKERWVKFFIVLAAAGPTVIILGNLAKAIGSITTAMNLLAGSAAGKVIIGLFGSVSSALLALGLAAGSAYGAFVIGNEIWDATVDVMDEIEKEAEEAAGMLRVLTGGGIEPAVEATKKLEDQMWLLQASLDNMVSAGMISTEAAADISDGIGELYEQVKDAPDLEAILGSEGWAMAFNAVLEQWTEDYPYLERLLIDFEAKTAAVGQAATDALLPVWQMMGLLGSATGDAVDDISDEYQHFGAAVYELSLRQQAAAENSQLWLDNFRQDAEEWGTEYKNILSDSFSSLVIELVEFHDRAQEAQEAHEDRMLGIVEAAQARLDDINKSDARRREDAQTALNRKLEDIELWYQEQVAAGAASSADKRVELEAERQRRIEDAELEHTRKLEDLDTEYTRDVEDNAADRIQATEDEIEAYEEQRPRIVTIFEDGFNGMVDAIFDSAIDDVIQGVIDDMWRMATESQQAADATNTSLAGIGGGSAGAGVGAAALPTIAYAGAAVVAGDLISGKSTGVQSLNRWLTDLIYGAGTYDANRPGTVEVTPNQSFHSGGMVKGPAGQEQTISAMPGEFVGYPGQMIDYEAMADAVADGVEKANLQRPVIVQLPDGTQLARALYNPLQREEQRRGGAE